MEILPGSGTPMASRKATNMAVVGPMVAQTIAPCKVPIAGTIMDAQALMEGKHSIWYGTQKIFRSGRGKMTPSPMITLKQNSCGREIDKMNMGMVGNSDINSGLPLECTGLLGTRSIEGISTACTCRLGVGNAAPSTG